MDNEHVAAIAGESGTGNSYSTLFRQYDPRLGRWLSVDPLADKFPSVNSYVGMGNNPVMFVDMAGDSAWKILNTWSDENILKYRNYVRIKTKEYIKKDKKFTCEDLALSLLIDFASNNKLPVTIMNETGIFTASSDDYSNTEDFKNDVLTTTGARDLQLNNNALRININDALAGDLILNRRNNNIARHVQIFETNMNSIGIFGIVQGNSGALNIVPGSSSIFQAGNPSSWFYTGKNIESAIYVPYYDFYKNYSTGRMIDLFSIQNNIEVRRWNFGDF